MIEQRKGAFRQTWLPLASISLFVFLGLSLACPALGTPAISSTEASPAFEPRPEGAGVVLDGRSDVTLIGSLFFLLAFTSSSIARQRLLERQLDRVETALEMRSLPPAGSPGELTATPQLRLVACNDHQSKKGRRSSGANPSRVQLGGAASPDDPRSRVRLMVPTA